MISEKQLAVLTALCNLPTAPYAEQHVIAYLLAWARERKKYIRVGRDPAGNVHLHYKRGRVSGPPLVVEAHMDHPGFKAIGRRRDGKLVAQFLGGVKPSHFTGATAAFWVDEGWIKARVLEARPVESKTPPKHYVEVVLQEPKQAVPAGSLGMWSLPDATVKGKIFRARVCDDIAGVAAILCLMDELIEQKVAGHVIGLCTRAEEVGFAGVIAAAKNGWIPKDSRVIGLETSKGSAFAAQGAGPIVRVGDRAGIFSAGLTHFICQAAAGITDADAGFKWQRKLMDGGTCNSTAFLAFGYDAAGMCVALGNYHNMTVEGEMGFGQGAKAGPGIGSETIHLGDFAGMVRILVETAKRMGSYKPGFGVMRERLEKLHEEEQREMLYGTSDQG